MIRAEIIDHIGIITLARPNVHNAINQETMEQLEEVLVRWSQDAGVKMLLLTGEGEAYFCSGGDIEEFHLLDKLNLEKMLHKMKEVLYQLQTYPKPTVVALNGTALGGGCELATACDFRLAHSEVELGFIQIKLGITTGWGGATRLFQIVPSSKAMYLLLSGQKITAEEAFELGLIDKLVSKKRFLLEALEWCKPLTQSSLSTLISYKQTYLDQSKVELSMEEKLTREVNRSAELWGSVEHKQVVTHFINKSKKK